MAGDADDPRRRDPAWVLGEALRLAATIWENEDRHVERQPGYDVDVTVDAAVELAGAVKALDGLLQGGYPLPHAWQKVRPARRSPGVRVERFRLGWWPAPGSAVRLSAVTDAVGRLGAHVRDVGRRLGHVTRPRRRRRS